MINPYFERAEAVAEASATPAALLEKWKPRVRRSISADRPRSSLNNYETTSMKRSIIIRKLFGDIRSSWRCYGRRNRRRMTSIRRCQKIEMV